jgi:hypothetical protein
MKAEIIVGVVLLLAAGFGAFALRTAPAEVIRTILTCLGGASFIACMVVIVAVLINRPR